MPHPRKYVYIDTETKSPLDLKRAGTIRYAEACEVLCVTWIPPDSEAICELWECHTSPMPESLERLLADPMIQLVAHNAMFDRAALLHGLKEDERERLRLPLDDVERWVCTAAMCRYFGLPGSLFEAGRRLNLPDYLRKVDDSGGIRYFTRTTGKEFRTPEEDPVRWVQFMQYAVQDTYACRAIHRALASAVPQIAKTYWREMERYVYELDQDMNCRGFRVDPEMLDSVLCMLEKLHPLMEQKLSELTNGEVQKVQSPKLRPYLQSEFLMELPNLQKDTVAAVLDENDLDARARELLLLRKHGARNSLAKYGRVSSMVSADLRVRAGYLYYGASTTGRWAGQGCQPQNLPRPTEESHDPVEIARACVQCSGDPAALEMLYDEPIYDVLVSGIRGCVVPAPGSVFVIGDYSQIESRITAWYAHCNLKLQAFHEHDTGQSGLDPYERTALDVLGDPSFRFEGKTMDLGLGFGMGVDKFSAVAKLEPARARELCYGWRETYPEIPRLWGTLAAALHRTLGNSFQTRRLEDPGIRDLLSVRGVRARKHNNQLVSLTLPSGRPLFYHGLRYATWGECMARAALHNRVSETKSRFGRYMGRDYVSGDDAALPNTSQLSCIHAHGYRKFLHGGLVTENIVQGLARDVLCEHALQLWQDYALLPVLHSHDELVYEVSENDAEATRELVRSYMEKGVSFLSSLPIRAEVSISPRYTKS